MIKRPLCAAAVLFLSLQAILAGGLRIAPDLKPSDLEQHLEGGETVTLEGTVYRREEKPDYRVLYLKDNRVRHSNKIFQESKILVYIETANHIKIGNQIRISGKADVFQTARNPGNFNQKFYYQKQGIHAFVWGDSVEIQNDSVFHVRESLAVLRAAWKQILIDKLGDYYGNSMSAILLGDKSELDSELKELYQKSGIGHILAISGLHMSFLGIGLYKLLRKFGLPFGIAGGMGVLFLLAYTLMIGCGVSSLRAFVMFFVRMGADITGRDYDMPTSLALAAAVIVAWQPLYLFDAGFLLSFGALLGITGVYPCLEFCFLKGKKAKKMFGSILASLAINLTLLPVMLYFYFEFPLYSILLNLLVIPCMSLVLGSGAIGSAVTLLSGEMGGTLLLASKGILYVYEKACTVSMMLPMSRIVAGQPTKGAVALYYGILLLFCLIAYGLKKTGCHQCCTFIGRDRHKKIFGAVWMSVLLGFLFLSCHFSYGSNGKLTVTMLDVGQGDGLYLKGPEGIRYFVDGGSSDVSAVGKYRIEPFLKSQGTKSLDYVFVSHGDADHMNGIEELLENQKLGIRIRNLVLPPERVHDEKLKKLAAKAVKNHTRVVMMEKGDIIAEGKFQLTCLAPSASYKGEPGNAASMVLEAELGEFEMLFTGDVEGDGEKCLETEGVLKQYDILKVAHHGSRNSSSEDFLEQTLPRIAWISSGIQNRYGHPHEETVERLKTLGSQIYGTQECGAVTLVTEGEKVKIKTYKTGD